MLNRHSLWNNTVKISDMEISHLTRTIKLLRTYAKERTNNKVNGYDTQAFGHKIHQWVHILNLEMKRRTGKTL